MILVVIIQSEYIIVTLLKKLLKKARYTQLCNF